MKKWRLGAVLALVLIVPLSAACGGDGDDDDGASPTASPSAASTTAAATSSPEATTPAGTSEPAATPTPSATPLPLSRELREGFEEGSERWEAAGTVASATFAVSTEIAATGSASLEVVTLADGEYRGVTIRAPFETLVTPGDDFVLNLALRAPSVDDLYFIGVSWFDSSGAFIGDAHVEDTPDAADVFEPWELGGTVPEGAATGRVTIYRVTNSAVKFYVDEVFYRVRGTD